MNTLCWNCRGLGDPATVHELRDITRECAPTVLCVVETQIAKYRVEGLASTLGFDNAFGVGSSGRSGSLCIYWKNSVDLTLRNYSKYHIDMTVKEVGNDPWRLTCWYGEANRSLRHLTWNMMRFLKADSDMPWVNISDFNEVLRREEQMGPNDRDMGQIQAFRDVDTCGLTDLGFVGLDWTFERKVQGGQYCRVRLDRALASTDWCTLFPMAKVRHLVASRSDHSPVLLMNDPEASNGRVALDRPFRYEVMWERHDGFEAVVDSAWASNVCSNTVDLVKKLKQMASTLCSWSKSSFGSVRAELRRLRKELE